MALSSCLDVCVRFSLDSCVFCSGFRQPTLARLSCSHLRFRCATWTTRSSAVCHYHRLVKPARCTLAAITVPCRQAGTTSTCCSTRAYSCSHLEGGRSLTRRRQLRSVVEFTTAASPDLVGASSQRSPGGCESSARHYHNVTWCQH